VSWMDLDDRILEHPKFIRVVKLAGSDAVFLWLGIRAYCAQLLTDGFVPGDMIDEVRGPREPKKRAAALNALVEVTLIERVDGGFFMHDFLDWSKSRAQIEEQRAHGAIRSALRSNTKLMREIRERDGNRCRYCACAVDWRDRRGPKGGTYDHVTPLSRGGGAGIDNVVVACRQCNSSKGDKLLPEWGHVLLPVDYQIPTGSVPSPVLVSRARAGEEGSGSGEGDPDLPEGDARGAQPVALRPAGPSPGPKLWTVHEWRDRFGRAWAAKYQTISYGDAGDTKACVALGFVLDALPPAERLAAQAKAPEMFAEFLASASPTVVNRRHPFVFFAQEWGGLRVARQATAPPKPPDKPWVAAEKADEERKARERMEARKAMQDLNRKLADEKAVAS